MKCKRCGAEKLVYVGGLTRAEQCAKMIRFVCAECLIKKWNEDNPNDTIKY